MYSSDEYCDDDITSGPRDWRHAEDDLDDAAEEAHECLYCGLWMEDPTEVPAVADDEGWARLAMEHSDDCEWFLSRAHRDDAEARVQR